MVVLSVFAFLVFGVMLVLVGVHQAAIARDLALGLGETGMLAGALAFGAGFGITVAGPLYDRVSRGWLFAASAALVAASLSSVHGEMTYLTAAARIAVAGVGAGAYNTVVNASISERYGAAAARPLTGVHASATLGAMAGPLVIAALGSNLHWTTSFRAVGLAHLLVAALAVALRGRYPAPHARALAERKPLSASYLPWLAIAFAYVALEASVTTFAVPFAARDLLLSPSRGQVAISTFWLGVLTSRLALMALRHTKESNRGALVVVAGVVGAGMIAATAGGVLPVELSFGLFGASIGFVYPLTMVLIGSRFPESRGTATGLAGGAGAVGAVIVPWITGMLGDARGVGFAVASLASWCALIAVGGLWIARPAPAATGAS
ncbi:MAG: MFS transporter [Myxococcales bacterium]|nr:MFS transporter [Myxococcales bacterium]